MYKFLNVILTFILLSVSTCNKKVEERNTEIYESINTDNVEYSVDSLIQVNHLPFSTNFDEWSFTYYIKDYDGNIYTNYGVYGEMNDTLYVLTVAIKEGRDIITYRKEAKGKY